jgi:hypothetical protein
MKTIQLKYPPIEYESCIVKCHDCDLLFEGKRRKSMFTFTEEEQENNRCPKKYWFELFPFGRIHFSSYYAKDWKEAEKLSKRYQK